MIAKDGLRMRLAATALCVALTGCSAGALRPGPEPGPGQPPTSTNSRLPNDAERSQQAGAASSRSSASVALLDQSRADRVAGRLDQAAATIERGLAIDPNNASLWIELAEIRLVQGDRDQADTLARKALTLAGADRSIAERADRLVRF